MVKKVMDQIIQTENLDFWYSDAQSEESRHVLKKINLSIPQGQFVAVLGHNGSGKSTLAKHFNSILLPMGGKVYVHGIDTSDENQTYTIRQNVGMVFQNPDNQIVASIVEEDVAFALENLGVPPEEIRKRVDWALEAVHMTEFKEHASYQLSGGQKQRVAIAGIIAIKPKCIVLDEPTAMLDPSGRREVMETIRRLCREEKITIVHITHYMNEAVQADRVIVMDHGSMIMDGTPKEVFVQVEKLKKVRLDVPQEAELLYQLKSSGLDVPLSALTVDECIDVIKKVLEE